MGMIWNSEATLNMLQRINSEFSNDMSGNTPNGSVPPIAKWRAMRSDFDKVNRKELKSIAKSNQLYGGGTLGSVNDVKWQAWLGFLGNSGSSNSNHEKLRKAIYEGLDVSKFDAIYFSLVPLKRGANIKVTAYPDEDDRIMGVLIETPTIEQVKASLRSSAKAKSKAKAKKKL